MTLPELRAALEGMTTGPWFAQGGLIHGPDRGGLDIGGLLADTYPNTGEDAPEFVAHSGPDAAGIVALRNAASDLLRLAEAAVAWEQQVRDEAVAVASLDGVWKPGSPLPHVGPEWEAVRDASRQRHVVHDGLIAALEPFLSPQPEEEPR